MANSDQQQKCVVMLMTGLGLNREQRQNQERALNFLVGRGIPHETIDGADPENWDTRNKLFSISGRKGTYPQFFVLDSESVEFVGDFDTIEAMNDASGLPCEILERHPEIMTWEKIMK